MQNQGRKRLNCPVCKTAFDISQAAAKPGAIIPCPKCGKKLRLPGGPRQAPSATASSPIPGNKRSAGAGATGAGRKRSVPTRAAGAVSGEGVMLLPDHPGRKKKVAALIWSIVVLVAIVGVTVGIIIKAKSTSSPQTQSPADVMTAAATGQGGAANQSPASPATPAKMAERDESGKSPADVARTGDDGSSGDIDSATATAAAANSGADDAAERRLDDTLAANVSAERSDIKVKRGDISFEPYGSTAMFTERPGMMYQVVKIKNECARYVNSARIKVDVVINRKVHATKELTMFDVPPGGTRLMVVECAVPEAGGDEIEYHPSYSNLTVSDEPVFDISSNLRPLVRDGKTDGTAVFELAYKGSREMAGMRVCLLLLRENGDFCGYQESVVSPLTSGKSRLQELRWRDWPNYMISKGIVQVEGLMEQEAAAAGGITE